MQIIHQFYLMCLLIVPLVVLVAASPSSPEKGDEYISLFEQFVSTYNKVYSSEVEREERFAVFKDNLYRIEELNNFETHARFGINKFADLSKEEFKAMYLSSIPAVPSDDLPVAAEIPTSEIASIPDSIDWRKKGAVTAVKNQGQCGSCWAFSTTGNVEGQWFLAGHELVGLSEQNLVDCDHECMNYDGSKSCDEGCDGGLQPNAYHYIISTGGIDTESSYPYEGVDDTCRYKSSNIGAKIKNYTMISKDEKQMAAYCAQHGPLAIAADAVEWQFYIGGVFDAPCGTTLDHGILIVGYDSEIDMFGSKIDYWIVKNSWGADWGQNGYIYLERGVGECGCNLFVSSAIV